MRVFVWIALVAMGLGLVGVSGAGSEEETSEPEEQASEPRSCEDFMESPGFEWGAKTTVEPGYGVTSRTKEFGFQTPFGGSKVITTDNYRLGGGSVQYKSNLLGGQCISTKKAVNRAFEQRGREVEKQEHNQ